MPFLEARRRRNSWRISSLTPELLEARDVPSTFFVDDNFANPALGQDPDGSGPATSFGTDSFATIQDAVNAANDGDTIVVNDGTYFESNIQIPVAVTIQGQSRAGVVITPDIPDVNDDSSFSGAFRHGFIVESDGVTIRSLTINGDLPATPTVEFGYRDGIVTDFFFTPGPYNRLTVNDVAIRNVYKVGVQLSDVSDGNSITGSVVDNVGLSGSGVGIMSFGGSGVIGDNTITNTANGIGANFVDPVNTGTGSPRLTIVGNAVTVRGGGIGLNLFGLLGGSTVIGNTINLTADAARNVGILFGDARSGQTTIQGNTITAAGPDMGIEMSEASVLNQPLISGNTLTSTGATSAATAEGVGILLTDDPTITSSINGDTVATISNNTITGFVTGIRLFDSATPPADATGVSATITDQALSGMTNGLLATGGGGDLTFTNVTVANNTGVGLSVVGFTTVTINGLTLTSNAGTQTIATTSGGTISVTVTSGATPFTVTASGTQLQFGPTAGTSNQPIVLASESALNLIGGLGADLFTITPPATGTTITIDGGLPDTPPGDVLDLNLTGITGTVLSTTTPLGYSGAYTFSNAGDVSFHRIETLIDAGIISGRVFDDRNGNGTQDAGEPGVVNQTVQLDFDANGTVDRTTTSNPLGDYSFNNLPAGVYRVIVPPPPGANATTTDPVVLTIPLSPPTPGINFGLHFASGTSATSTVTGIIFNDLNQNGNRGAGEPGVNGLIAYLDVNGNAILDANEPSTVSATVGGVAGSFTLISPVSGTAVAVRAVEKPGFVTNTTGSAVYVTAGQTQTADIGVLANVPPQTAPSQQFGVIGVVGGQATAHVYNPDASPAYNVTAYTGDARVAVGDVTGDGIEDVVIGTGVGSVALIRVISGATHQEVYHFDPFDVFSGGVFITLGDLTGDGIRDIVVTPDRGGGPRVVVVRGGDFPTAASFFGIDDPDFRGGARAAVGDVNADGWPDLAVAAGFLGGPRVALFDGRTILNGGTPTRLVHDFFAFESTLRNGAYVAIGDTNGDGYEDLIFGAGPGGAPRILEVSGQIVMTQGTSAAFAAPLANFYDGDPNNRLGIRLATKDLNGDGRADILTGVGGNGTLVAGYRGYDLAQLFTLSSGSDPLGSLNGVFVG